MGPLFEFVGVDVCLDESHVVLADIDLVIPDHGITAILGPSGSGKSTLLRLCNRLEVPSRGVVRYRGADVGGLDPLEHRRTVGMVFQRPTPFPGTVRDNLLVARPGATEENLIGALARAALDTSFLDREADRLSGGEAQRVCLARTLVTDPDVLLMDEPTSALDQASAGELERLTCGLADAGVATLWVTHDVDQAARVAARRVSLRSGRIIERWPDPDRWTAAP